MAQCREAKYSFNVLNVSLERELVCGPFSIRPLDGLEGQVDRDGPIDDAAIPTAIGDYAIPEAAPDDDTEYHRFAMRSYDEFSVRAEVVELLLSFAQRRHVQIWHPNIYVKEGSEWRRSGGGRIYPDVPGPHRGTSMFLSQRELEDCLTHSYALMTGEIQEMRSGAQRTGLRLALLLLEAASLHQGEVVETSYLKAWIAFEILVNHSGTSESLLDSTQFKQVRNLIKGAIRPRLEEYGLSSEQREAIYRKIPELNREGIKSRAFRFLTTLFTDHPVQKVTQEDVDVFVEIRDGITHTGAMPWKEDDHERTYFDDYPSVIVQEQQRLVSLLERIIPAMLGVSTRLLEEVPWQDYLEPY